MVTRLVEEIRPGTPAWAKPPEETRMAMAAAKTARVLWLHTQPEHYFNLMIDELNAHSDLEYIAAFLGRGPGLYKDVPVPQHSRSIFLRIKPGQEGDPSLGFRARHVDWRADIAPLDVSCVVVPGYAGTTQRQIIRHMHRQGVPVLMTNDSNLRSQRGRTLKARFKRAIKKRVLAPIIRDVDRLLPVNTLGVAYWRYYGAPRQKIVVSSYYADYARVEQGRQLSRDEVLGWFKLDPGRKLILTAARLVEAKGLDLMIDAFRKTGLDQRGWIYAIAGTGPLEAPLKALAGAALGRSIFFLGFTQPAQLMPLFCHADLFALPSRYEPHGIVVGEAACAGTPILASDVVGAARDLVRPGISGWTFRSGDPADLQRALRAAAGDEARLAAMRATTRAAFEEWFVRTNPVVVADRVIHGLLAARAGSEPPPSSRASASPAAPVQGKVA